LHEWVSYIPIAFAMVFGIIFILLGLLLVVIGWSTLRRSFGQSNWIRIPAEILSATVEPRTLDEVKFYLPKVTYRFSVGGATITSSRMRLAEKMYSTSRKAERQLQKYPPGTNVMASYPAGQPKDVVLEPGGSVFGFVMLLLGLAMVIGPLFLAASEGYDVIPISLTIVVVFVFFWGVSLFFNRRDKQARRDGFLPPIGSGTDADVERLLLRGKKLLAIRLYKEIHNTDLKAAKEAVEAIDSQQKN